MNDYAGGYKEWSKLATLPMGKGNVDFEAFFAYIKRIGYDGTFTIEATAFDKDGVVEFEMLNRCVTTIRNSI